MSIRAKPRFVPFLGYRVASPWNSPREQHAGKLLGSQFLFWRGK
jgi:hypothetical protein